MTSILTTIAADFQKVVAVVKTDAVQIGDEVISIVESVGKSAWTQALALIKESHIGTEAINAIEAVEASGGNIVEALPTIIADIETLINQLKTEGGSVIGGLETEALSIATALVNDLKTDFLGNATVAAIVAAL